MALPWKDIEKPGEMLGEILEGGKDFVKQFFSKILEKTDDT